MRTFASKASTLARSTSVLCSKPYTRKSPSSGASPFSGPRSTVTRRTNDWTTFASSSSMDVAMQGLRATGSPLEIPESVVDYTSFANFQDIRAYHLDLALDVDLDSKVLRGLATFHMQSFQDMVQTIVMDTRHLKIDSVELQEGIETTWIPATFHLHEADPVKGSKLVINLRTPQSRGAQVRVRVQYSVGEDSTALQFLSPEMTSGKKHPFLFSQCQAIHARSMVPCQDSPAAKFSYSAAVRVKKPLTALMSAVSKHGGQQYSDPDVSLVPAFATHLYAQLERQGLDRTDFHVFTFEQKVPISSYLIALAVGDMESRDVGPRSRVWAERDVVESAAYEFAETDKFLQAAESLAGPYSWGRYDMLLLPWSFPFGGMENPTMTFLTPSLLAGDRSLTNVVAHEIAHSWTGNNVTNSSWSDFWLNEGWTVFLERKIVEKLKGRATYEFYAAQGYAQLEETVRTMGATHNYTRLIPDLSNGGDPDDSFSRVPYEKGFYFLHYLSQTVGHAEFEQFIKDYCAAFKFKVLTSSMFKEFYIDYFTQKGMGAKIACIEWDKWLYEPGMPPKTNEYDVSLATQAYKLAEKWHTSDLLRTGKIDDGTFAPQDVSGWTSDQLCAFLERLGKLTLASPLHPATARALGSLYGLLGSKNSEVLFAYLKVAIAAKEESALEPASTMLRTIGRLKFVRPLYRALKHSGSDKFEKAAHDLYEEMKGKYHPVASLMVGRDLAGTSAMAD